MKSKRNKLTVGGVAGITAMFLLSPSLSAFQPFAKAGALVIYALVNYVQIEEMKHNGQDIGKPALFTAAVLIVVGYLLLFTQEMTANDWQRIPELDVLLKYKS